MARKLIPSRKVLGDTIKDGLIAGGIGGAAIGIARQFLGLPLGSVVGGIVGGSIVHGVVSPTAGKIVAINGTMDAVASMFFGA